MRAELGWIANGPTMNRSHADGVKCTQELLEELKNWEQLAKAHANYKRAQDILDGVREVKEKLKWHV